uniref:Uncharacterized protein n=1 Tax=Zooxanthella nutricula TaxID=1333877 RepID=A0A6U6UP35_9DINO|mmetsp:Transcript_85699/g.262219  ORF Transcript_85699/g.262219 Transcript_85699/m.262219 type:complete len:592 (+) Transcript_85699:72-1847(+)
MANAVELQPMAARETLPAAWRAIITGDPLMLARASLVSSKSTASARPHLRGAVASHSSHGSMVARQAQQVLSFDDPALFRGTRATTVMRCWGRVLGERLLNAKEHYELSECVDHVDAFLSHNWSTPRHEKFLGLAVLFNLRAAVYSAAVTSVLCFLCTAAGLAPTIQTSHAGDEYPRGYLCQVMGMIVFVATLILWQEVGPLLGFRGPVVFLDKVCVHQLDPALKRQGIEKLAAFVRYSWSMVVFYNDSYLKKLWTVYELATYLLMDPNGLLHMQPVSVAKTVLLGMGFVVVRRALFLFFWSTEVLDQVATWLSTSQEITSWMLSLLAMLPQCLFMGFVTRKWAQEQASIIESVSSFSISQTLCAQEEDRRLVEGNIEIFVKHFFDIHRGMSREEALRHFEEVVRTEVPNVLRSAWGDFGWRYMHTQAIFGVQWLYLFDCWAGQARTISRAWGDGRKVDARVEFLHAANIFNWITSQTCIAGPLASASAFLVAKSSLKPGVGPMRGVLATTCAAVIVYQGCYLASDELFALAHRSLSFEHTSLHAAVNLIMLCMTLWVYRRPPTQRFQRRLHDRNDVLPAARASARGGVTP